MFDLNRYEYLLPYFSFHVVLFSFIIFKGHRDRVSKATLRLDCYGLKCTRKESKYFKLALTYFSTIYQSNPSASFLLDCKDLQSNKNDAL